jgi:hypothetical protein
MSEPEQPKKKSWGSLQWGVVLIVVCLSGCGIVMTLGVMRHEVNLMGASTSARQIIMGMKMYANDHDGVYPDSAHPEAGTANQVFRRLFQEEIFMDERLFGGVLSRFSGDGNEGTEPDYAEAVAAGENHWALVAGQGQKTPEHHPLVFENALDATWPPKWAADSAGRPIRGRTWQRNRIVVGFNDNSVEALTLEKTGTLLTLPKTVLKPEGKTAVPVLKILDIEERAH